MLEVESPPDAGLTVQLVDSATGHVIATTSTSQVGTPAATGRMQVAPGRYIVRVGTSGDAYDRSTLRGPYRLWFYRFGYGPEAVSDTFANAVGDAVRGEAVFPGGDIDEFTSTAVPGDTLTAYIRLTAPPVGGDQFHGLTLEVIDTATGNALTGSLAQFFGQTFNPVGSFAVPAGGGFLIRVRGSGTFGDELTTAPYEFFVRRGP